MDNLKQRISDAIENELASVFEELKVETGDIMPDQLLKWHELTQKMADLFAEIIDQNK